MKYIITNLCLLLLASFAIVGCQTVPYSGRSQLMFTSESEENEMGRKAWDEIKKQNRVSTNKKLTAAVKRVGRNCAKVANKPNYNWEFVLFDNPQVNAFCLPGGKIGVYTGIFKYMSNDSELAAVIGHEIGHAVARHAGERISQAQLQAIGQQVLASSVKSNVQEWMMAYGLASQLGVALPYSRAQEYEADHLGLIYMAKAGYHPKGALDFWAKFSKISKTSTLAEYFSTHPMSSKRMAEMETRIPEAMQHYNKAPAKRAYGEKY